MAQETIKIDEVKGHKEVSFRTRLTFVLTLPQPSHVVCIAAVVYVASLLRSSSSGSNNNATCRIVHLAAFGAHFGTQIWMTFVSGIVLYFRIPRHMFAQVQRQLFPSYFLLNGVLSLVALATLPASENGALLPTVLAARFCVEAWTITWLVPPLLALLAERTELELDAGSGTEIGRHEPGPILAVSERYQSVHRRFRRLHAVCACANVATVACSALHLTHLAARI